MDTKTYKYLRIKQHRDLRLENSMIFLKISLLTVTVSRDSSNSLSVQASGGSYKKQVRDLPWIHGLVVSLLKKESFLSEKA